MDIDNNTDIAADTSAVVPPRSAADDLLDSISCQFRSMNTNDKDQLIAEFKRLSNTQLSNDGCLFYLDLAEWNLNTALWAYYEYESAGDSNRSINSASAPNSSNILVEASPSQTSSSSFVLPSTRL